MANTPKDKPKDGVTMTDTMVTIRRGNRTTSMSRAEWEKRRARLAGTIYGRITSDSKIKDITPNEILFGPAHADLPPSQEANFNPATGDYPRPPGMKKYY